jgi:membrane protein DedA with SNARE-associated domain
LANAAFNAELLVYLGAFIGPFVQEDAAIWGAVTAFEHPKMQLMADGRVILAAMLSGLIISDLWKYWIGYFARRHACAAKMAAKPNIEKLSRRIVASPGVTLMAARFVPGTRIPAYIAAGLFKVPFGVFAAWIAISAIAYTGVAWIFVATVGKLAGERAMVVLALLIAGGLLSVIAWAAVKRWINRSAV